jgi:hypothetical protein
MQQKAMKNSLLMELNGNLAGAMSTAEIGKIFCRK